MTRKIDIVRRHIIQRLRDGGELDKARLFRGTRWGARLCQRALRDITISRHSGFGENKRVWYKLNSDGVSLNRRVNDKYGMIIFRMRERMADTEDEAERRALARAIRRLK